MQRETWSPEDYPGLRRQGRRLLWRATKKAVKAGYSVKSVNLTELAGEPDALKRRCDRLQYEMKLWLSGRAGKALPFNGTIRSLIDIYENDPGSTFHKLKPSSAVSYIPYMKVLREEVGDRRIDCVDGRDLDRWHSAWCEPAVPDGNERIARAHMIVAVLKAALSFGIQCRMKGCADLKAILSEKTFTLPRPRTAAPTAQEIVRARAAAHEFGHPRAALAYALQYEAMLRQWDVLGTWTPLSDARPSAVIYGRHKWLGPTWVNIDDKLVLTITPSKTERTTGKEIKVDLTTLEMVMEEIEKIPAEERKGPLITDPKTGRPYTKDRRLRLWRKVAKKAEIPAGTWNRDLRAGGITEGRAADVRIEDMAKVAGHATERTTAKVYDRAVLEAGRRVADARRTARRTGRTDGS